jgi:uncharacterized membrane protein HdeD (DUF308 family)
MQDWMTLRWTMLLARGLVGVAFGVLAMAWPDETVTVLVVIWGCWALIDGAITLAVVGRVPGTAPKVVAIVSGVVALLWGLAVVGLAFFVRRAGQQAGADLPDPAYG